MSKLSSLVREFGIDQDSLLHLKWLLEQNPSRVHELLEEVQSTRFESAVSDIFASSPNMWNTAPLGVAAVLNEYGRENFVQMSTRLELRFSDFAVTTQLRNEYLLDFDVSVYIDKNFVRTYRVHSLNLYGISGRINPLGSVADAFERISQECLNQCSTFVISTDEDPLQVGLMLEGAKKELNVVQDIFNAWDRPGDIAHVDFRSMVKQIIWCLKLDHQMYYKSLKELIKLYIDTTQNSTWLIQQINDILVIRDTQRRKMFLDDPNGKFVRVTKRHPEYERAYLCSQLTPMPR